MRVVTVFLQNIGGGAYKATATIEVPGLGKVEIQQALSDELNERIRTECITALRLKLGQPLDTPTKQE